MARFTRWLRRLALFAALALGLGVLALGILYWLIAPRLPDVQELRHVALQVPLSVYSSDGKLIAQFGETRRYPVKVANIPKPVKDAFIAIEDARFYHHQGLDFRGISRAIWLLATTDAERVPGGSTITQQVAKNFYLSSEYSYSRKVMEMLLALKMERELSKDEILELYLNKIFFGNRAYGVVAAAEYYFGKPLNQLTLAEAASLAATPKFPSSANPRWSAIESSQGARTMPSPTERRATREVERRFSFSPSRFHSGAAKQVTDTAPRGARIAVCGLHSVPSSSTPRRKSRRDM